MERTLPLLPGQDSDKLDKRSLELGCLKFLLEGSAYPLDFTSCHCQPQFYQKWENPFYMLTYPEPLCTDSQQRGRRVLLKAIIQSQMRAYECNPRINQLQ